MPLPETISVRHTEEEAGYVSVRPVVQETFRLRELADMVIRVTGKDRARVRKIFRAGTVVYNGYRYWWAGFESGEEELDALLAAFPDDDPSRPFRAEECAAVLLEAGGGATFRQLEITRAQAGKKRFWRRSPWEALLPGDAAALVYAGSAWTAWGAQPRNAPEPPSAATPIRVAPWMRKFRRLSSVTMLTKFLRSASPVNLNQLASWWDDNRR